MAVEIISWRSLHEKNVPDMGIDLGADCMPGGHACDRATAPGSYLCDPFTKQLFCVTVL